MRITDYFTTESSYFNTQLIKPYIIAEAGVNHEGRMDLAKRLINEAKEGGAQAIKFQTYKADKIASKDSPAYWDLTKESTSSQHELFKKYDKFWKKEYEELKRYCEECDIEFMSTPFDTESASFLNDLVNVHKISSSDLNNLPFIELISSFGKPIILSTGASFIWEIQQAVELIEKHGTKYCLMHCILNYPTDNKNANLGMLIDLARKFSNAIIGYSDHTLPNKMEVLKTAVLLGACIIEKHFTHDKTLPGNDHYHAMNKNDLSLFWSKMEETFEYIGDFKKYPLKSEEPSRRNARRSLVASRKIREGEELNKDNLTWKRPGSGISPQHFNEVVGRKASRDIENDEILQWNQLR